VSLLQYLRYRGLRKLKSLEAKPLKKRAQEVVARQWLQGQNPLHENPLTTPVMVNLTSFPKRYKHLHLTLKSLLLQDIAPFQLNLWLFRDDIDALPDNVKALTQYGLSIYPVDEDIRSYKKLIPALQQFPDAYHVTADDDIYYRPDWLSQLLLSATTDRILCWRAHRITRYKDGQPKAYRRWEPKTEHRGPSNDLFFTSGGGVLFPPGALDERVTDIQLAQQLAPYADDLWWYMMARLKATPIERVGNNPALVNWPDSREGSLWQFNKSETAGNDVQLHNLIDYFSFKV